MLKLPEEERVLRLRESKRRYYLRNMEKVKAWVSVYASTDETKARRRMLYRLRKCVPEMPPGACDGESVAWSGGISKSD